MPGEQTQTNDSVGATVTRGNYAQSIEPRDTMTGLLVLGLLGYIVYRLLRG